MQAVCPRCYDRIDTPSNFRTNLHPIVKRIRNCHLMSHQHKGFSLAGRRNTRVGETNLPTRWHSGVKINIRRQTVQLAINRETVAYNKNSPKQTALKARKQNKNGLNLGHNLNRICRKFAAKATCNAKQTPPINPTPSAKTHGA